MAVNVATQTMMRLPSNELMSLQEDFESNPDGLLPAEFVRVMLNRAAQKAAHGGADDFVRPQWGEATYQQLRARGLDVQWKVYPGMRHELRREELDDLNAWMMPLVRDDAGEKEELRRT